MRNHSKEVLSPAHKPSQDHLIPTRSLSLSYIAITFSLFLTLVYNLIVACPDFTSLQTCIPNRLPSPSPAFKPVFYTVADYSARSLLFSETFNGFPQFTFPVLAFRNLPNDLPGIPSLSTHYSQNATLLQAASFGACGSWWTSNDWNYVQNFMYDWVSAFGWNSSHFLLFPPMV